VQNIVFDVGLLTDETVLGAPAEAIAGWFFALGHCTLTKSGGLIAKDRSRVFWARTMPPGVDFQAVVEAGLATDDGHGNWVIYGYNERAEAGHTAQQMGGKSGAEKRWGKLQNGSPNGSPMSRSPNGVPNGGPKVRQSERKTARPSVSQSVGTYARQYAGTEVGQEDSEPGSHDDSEEGSQIREAPPF
jgi:hypothetical protein